MANIDFIDIKSILHANGASVTKIVDETGDILWQAPGLYDANGKQLCTWDTLVSDGFDPDALETATSLNIYVNQQGDTSWQDTNGKYMTTRTVVMDNSITNMHAVTYENCRNLTTFYVGLGVTEIEGWTFANCDALTYVLIPRNVTSLGSAIFYQCDALTDIYYGGTFDEWNADNPNHIIEKDDDWRSGSSVTKVHFLGEGTTYDWISYG